MGKSSKKGRLTGGQRKEMNQRVVSAVLDDASEEILFGRVLRHLGQGHILVMLDDKREGIAKIRTALSRRGSTPIVTDDIVILSCRDFETKAGEKPRFDVLGIMTRAEASKLEKAGRIPSWFLQSADGIERGAEEEDVFDFSEAREADSDSDVDVDKI
jgi:translation initiation factor IF-1